MDYVLMSQGAHSWINTIWPKDMLKLLNKMKISHPKITWVMRRTRSWEEDQKLIHHCQYCHHLWVQLNILANYAIFYACMSLKSDQMHYVTHKTNQTFSVPNGSFHRLCHLQPEEKCCTIWTCDCGSLQKCGQVAKNTKWTVLHLL